MEVHPMIQYYLAGNYTSATEEGNLLNVRRAMLAAVKIIEARGWFPIVPHVSMNHKTPWPDAMKRCKETIRSLDPERSVLVLLPGWETSTGAIEEWELALELGMPVLTLEEALR
jgi:hypothetical protein